MLRFQLALVHRSVRGRRVEKSEWRIADSSWRGKKSVSREASLDLARDGEPAPRLSSGPELAEGGRVGP